MKYPTRKELGNIIGGIKMKVMLDEGAFMPGRAHEDDAGLDLRTPYAITVLAGEAITIDTGIHIEIPKGYFGKLESKSGLNVKHRIVSLGGVIDSGYTGTICVELYNFGWKDYTFEKGDKIVQLIIQPYAKTDLELVDSLEETERGNNGFGSSGK